MVNTLMVKVNVCSLLAAVRYELVSLFLIDRTGTFMPVCLLLCDGELVRFSDMHRYV